MILYRMIGQPYEDDDIYEGGITAEFMVDTGDGQGYRKTTISLKNRDDMEAIRKHFSTSIEPLRIQTT